jgi:PKD repeat protein
MPQPLLNLTYTIPENVTAGEPFNLNLTATNVGYGTAKNLKLDSGQPVIYENKAGLLITFELIASGLVNGSQSNSMLIDFGNLAPGESKEAYWVMKTSLDGNFTEFYGSFSHSNALGGAETSLINDIKYIIVNKSDTNPPSSITNLQSTNGTTWINWTWTNPADLDFIHTEIYLNGILKTNTIAEYYNATDLLPETSYTLSTRTVDNYGNVNDTWVNETATTGKMVLPVFPGSTKQPTDPNNDGLYEDINGNDRIDFKDVVAYYNNMDWIGQNVAVAYFDFNRNGRIDFKDVVKLYNMI